MIVVAWIIFSVLIGFFAKEKKIGFLGGLMLSLLLSPLVGFIIVLVSADATKEQSSPEAIDQPESNQGIDTGLFILIGFLLAVSAVLYFLVF